jgi:hypothetical protein
MRCGQNLKQVQYYQPPSQPITHPIAKKETPFAVIVAVVVVVAIILIAAVALIVVNVGDRATLVVNVYSHRVSNTISYRLYVDGGLKRTGSLDPLTSVQFTFSVPLHGESKTVNVYADSTGGGFGATSDSKNVLLEKDTTTTVNLSI